MRSLTISELDDLARGTAILGSGGGGDPSYNLQLTKQHLDQLQIISLEELDDEACVVPLAFMGAPLAALEKLPSGKEFEAIFHELKKVHSNIVLVPAEIGGANAFTPLWIGARMGLKVLDADTIGRAFPELQMSVCTLHKILPSPTYLADALGNLVTIQATDSHTVERIARNVTVAMGARGLVALYLMTGKVAKQVMIRGSISCAIELGQKRDFKPLTSGMIVDVDQRIDKGFLKGKVVLHDGTLILFQNEYLIVKQGAKVLASTPDIIMLLEEESGHPITSVNLKYGLRVNLITLQAPDIWKTPKGLSLVGPQQFKELL